MVNQLLQGLEHKFVFCLKIFAYKAGFDFIYSKFTFFQDHE